MGGFHVDLSPGGINISVSEVRESVDVENMLQFDEDAIENILMRHAADQSYWEALTVRLKNRHHNFKEEWSKKWWAYNKSFAKIILAAYGEPKPTMDAIKDMVIMIYSEDLSRIERDKYTTIAFRYADQKKVFEGSKEEFEKSMWKYLLYDNPWYFEVVQRTEAKLREDFEMVEIVAERLNSRSFHMQSLIDLVKAKRFNVDPKVYSDSKVHDAFRNRT